MGTLARLYITADDAGVCESLDRGITEALEFGLITRVAAFSNYRRTCAGLNKRLLSSLGIHFSISSGKPISAATRVPSIVDSDGSFISPTADARRGVPIQEAIQTFLTTRSRSFADSDVSLEIQAQADEFHRLYGQPPSFSSVHHDADRIPTVMKAVTETLPLLPGRSELVQAGRLSRYLSVFHPPDRDRNDALISTKQLVIEAIRASAMSHGVPAEIVCHPGLVSDEATEFTVYAQQRVTELHVWTSHDLALLFADAERHGDTWTFQTEPAGVQECK